MPMDISASASPATPASDFGANYGANYGFSRIENGSCRSHTPMDMHMEKGHESCALCEMTGSGHAVMDEANTYILENIGKVHVNEMAEQVTQAINGLPGKRLTKAMFHQHVTSHMRHQKIVLSILLDGLLEVAHISKGARACV
jgi:hypothetical protein